MGVLFPPPAPSHRGWALVGRELRLDSGLVLETLVGCLGLGWQPWAGLASAPLPSSSQTSICLLTSWPPRPFQFPGRSSVGQRKAVTCPAMATGATGPLLFWAEGLGDLGTSWGRHKHLRGSAGVPRVGSLQPHGLRSPWDAPGQNTGVGGLSLLQGIFPTQVSRIAGRFFTV